MSTASTITAETIVTGAEFQDFYQNHWPKEWYVENSYIYFEDQEGKFCLDPASKCKLGDFGWAGWHAEEDPPENVRSILIWELYAQVMAPRSHEIFVGFKIESSRVKELVQLAQSVGARLI